MLELARPEDREEVNRLARQVHAMHAAWRPDIYEMADVLFPEEMFLEAIAKREMFVAKIGEQIVGFALLVIREYHGSGMVCRKVMALDQICVDEPFRNQGIGTQMMTEIQALAKAFRCTDLQLSVYPQNDEAVAFYQKCGFTIRNINMHRKV